MIDKYRTILRHPTLWRRESAIYDLVKKAKAGIAVETGVNGGLSSSCILAALNMEGHLYSVDLKDPNRLRGRETGWLVPEELKTKWEVIFGDSKTILPQLVRRIPPVDFFHQESSDSYEDMMAEFRAIWPAMRSGGIMMSPYAARNQAFQDFCRNYWMDLTWLNKGTAFAVKR